MAHRIAARPARRATAPHIDADPAIVASFLSDAAHVPGGSAAGVAFPTDEGEVAALVAQARRILPVGAQSSLTGGATPRGDVVLSTRRLARLGAPASESIRAGAGVPLTELQRAVTGAHLYYPPVPTYDGAFIGGTVATNAAGAATFKYGSTRHWVDAITVVLASGDVLDITRGEVTFGEDGVCEIVRGSGDVISLRLPSYEMPAVAKLSAGYFARPGMDLIDLFIGSEGTLGVVTEVTLRLKPARQRMFVLIRCTGDGQAVDVTTALREEAIDAWAGIGPLDVAAVEYMDGRALRLVTDDVFTNAGVHRPDRDAVLLLVQVEVGDEDAALLRLQEVLAAAGVTEDPLVTAPDSARGAQRLLDLREAVPSSVNAMVAAAKSRHEGIQKTAGDMVVPFGRLADSLALYRDVFGRHELEYAIWGHVSDGNLHPNVIPRSIDDVERGQRAILDIARGVVAMGGAPLAEHGVGRSPLKQQLLRELYGDEGIDQMRAIKRALDPEWKLAPGVLFPR